MWYARTALAGSAFFGLSIVALHWLQPDLDPMTRAISQYARGPYGPLMTAAFVASGLASFALSLALAGQGTSRAGRVFLTVAGVGGGMSALFPVDADGAPDTITGSVHQIAGLGTFVSLIVAALLLTRGFGSNTRWRSFQRTSFVATALMLCGFVFVFAANAVDSLDGTFGLAQRAFIASAIAWQLLVARQASVRAGGAADHAASAGSAESNERRLDSAPAPVVYH